MNPFSSLMERFSKGLTLNQKLLITLGALLWVASPLDFDFIPLLGWIDDILVIKLLLQAWKSPTLAPSNAVGNLFRSLGKFAGACLQADELDLRRNRERRHS